MTEEFTCDLLKRIVDILPVKYREVLADDRRLNAYFQGALLTVVSNSYIADKREWLNDEFWGNLTLATLAYIKDFEREAQQKFKHNPKRFLRFVCAWIGECFIETLWKVQVASIMRKYALPVSRHLSKEELEIALGKALKMYSEFYQVLEALFKSVSSLEAKGLIVQGLVHHEDGVWADTYRRSGLSALIREDIKKTWVDQEQGGTSSLCQLEP